jgi:hypothetical protein
MDKILRRISLIGENIMTALEAFIRMLGQVVHPVHNTNPPATLPTDPSTSISTTITVDSRFSPAQEQEINDAMRVIFNLFGGADKFYQATDISNLKFIRPARLSCAQSNAVSCYVGNGVIEMTAGAFSPAPLVTGWYIAHEVGHAFDFSRSGGNPRLYRSQAFVEYFVPKNWLQRFLGLPVFNLASSIGYQGKLWTEIARTTGASIRGQLNSAEDFADTFAVIYAEAIIHGDLPYRSFNSRWRFDTVNAMIKGLA